MMRRFLITAAAIAGSAAAAAIAAPAMAQDENGGAWNGWYVGANIGMNWGDAALNTTASRPAAGGAVIPPGDVGLINTGSGGSNKTGFTGGIEGGYNWRMGYWLLGLETDYGALDVSQTATDHFQSTGPVVNPPGVPVAYTLNQHATAGWIWTVRPRVGIISGPWLFYATGGVAMGDVKLNMSFSDNRSSADSLSASNNSTKTGWAAGVGAGFAVTPNWSVKAEWLYADLGAVSTTATSPSGYVALTSKADVRSNLLRVGVDYRF